MSNLIFYPFRCQSTTNFRQQGNLYSSYKNWTTLKIAIGVTPSGMAAFVSDVHEGSISDREIIIKSDFCSHLEENDTVLADRGFNIEDLVLQKGANLVIPPFLRGRSKFNYKELSDSRVITRARVHVERFNQRLKLFKYVSDIVPQKRIPMINQAVFVCCCFVNFTRTFVD